MTGAVVATVKSLQCAMDNANGWSQEIDQSLLMSARADTTNFATVR
jgi:hypothetical protein